MPCSSVSLAGWSPEQVAGRLAKENGRKIISYESIYRWSSCSATCRSGCAGPSLSITAPSSRIITRCTGSSIKTFFCDPYAPWQKGGIENAIGRMRRFLPRKTDLATLSPRRFNALIAAYNNTPSKMP